MSAPALRFAALRALFAGALLVALSWLLRRPFPSGARTWLELSGIGLSLTAFGFGGMFLAGGRVTPGLATVVANAQPLVAALLGYLVLGEPLRGLRGLALAVGSSGIVVIAAPSLAPVSGSRSRRFVAWRSSSVVEPARRSLVRVGVLDVSKRNASCRKLRRSALSGGGGKVNGPLGRPRPQMVRMHHAASTRTP